MFQKRALDGNLTGEENIRLHAILYGVGPWRTIYRLMPSAYRARVEELAALLGLRGEIFKPVRTYSGGMRRKLEIVRSLLHRPKVLFLDEPSAGLDPPSRRTLWQYLAGVRRDAGTTIFLTTHYIEEAEEADTICIIDKGKVVSFGTPEAVKSRLVENYVLVDCADRAVLREQLRSLGARFTEGTRVRVELDGMSTHALLRSIEVPLTYVQTHMPSLEDAYLEIVGREET